MPQKHTVNKTGSNDKQMKVIREITLCICNYGHTVLIMLSHYVWNVWNFPTLCLLVWLVLFTLNICIQINVFWKSFDRKCISIVISRIKLEARSSYFLSNPIFFLRSLDLKKTHSHDVSLVVSYCINIGMRWKNNSYINGIEYFP